MAKISVRRRECDSLYKKTKAGTLGRMPLASGLTLSQHMHSMCLCVCVVGEAWKAGGRQALPSCVQFQPCRDPGDCPVGYHTGRPMATGHTLTTCYPEGLPIWSSGQSSWKKVSALVPPLPHNPPRATTWIVI